MLLRIGWYMKSRGLVKRRSLWLLGALLVVVAAAFGYYWVFGKAKVLYATAAVERGDIESTVVAAGIVQPIKYVDVGAQTSGKLKSLKVKRGDQVEKDQLLAEIDPALADTALTAANAALAKHDLTARPETGATCARQSAAGSATMSSLRTE